VDVTVGVEGEVEAGVGGEGGEDVGERVVVDVGEGGGDVGEWGVVVVGEGGVEVVVSEVREMGGWDGGGGGSDDGEG
ncbi:hypothetical protein, partial [Corynebacterium glyciniphilum]|uniref:hypothetical protein n=1 Tax=Corynebacterium glyciniphilum TaxID=1404244 RepID=UPI00164338D0